MLYNSSQKLGDMSNKRVTVLLTNLRFLLSLKMFIDICFDILDVRPGGQVSRLAGLLFFRLLLYIAVTFVVKWCYLYSIDRFSVKPKYFEL